MTHRIVLFLLFASLGFAQLDSNSVTVSATRSVNLVPDQLVFSVYVCTGLNAALSDVTHAIQSTGITLSDFTGLSSCYNGSPAPMLQWSFTATVSLDKMKDTLAALANLQQSISGNNSGFTFSFQVQGTQVSQQMLQAQTCPVADLLSDARAQAQKLAASAGMNAGAILAISSFVSSPVSGYINSGFVLGGTSVAIPNCSATVKFGLK